METARDRCLAETGALRLLHLRSEVLEVGLLVVGAREVRAPLQEGGLLVARPLELRWRGRPPGPAKKTGAKSRLFYRSISTAAWEGRDFGRGAPGPGDAVAELLEVHGGPGVADDGDVARSAMGRNGNWGLGGWAHTLH